MSLLKTNEIQNYNGSSLTLTASTVSTSAQLNTGGNISVTGSLNVSDDSTTRTNLGLGTIATQDSDSTTVTGGTATLGALTVSGSDSGDLVRITQTGSGNALVVEDSANPDSTPFVVNASGNLLVGTTSATRLNREKLEVISTTTEAILARTNGLSYAGYTYRDLEATAGTHYIGYWERSDGTFVGTITHNNSSTSYNTASDYRLKENITEITDGISRVKQLNPSRFNFIADPENTVDGFIAHEAAEVVPEAVTGEKDAVDSDGKPEYQGVDYGRITPLLTAALKEAIEKIEMLEARIAVLEAK